MAKKNTALAPGNTPAPTNGPPDPNKVLDPEYLKSHDDQIKLVAETLPGQVNRVQRIINELKEQRKLIAQEREALAREKQARDVAHSQHHQTMMEGLAQLSKLLEEALANPND